MIESLYLATSVVSLAFVALLAFVIAFRNSRWTLVVLVPTIVLTGILGISSYKSLLGYPVNLQWSDLPGEWTVLFFRVEGKANITLWLIDGNTTRLIELPYKEKAEEALQGQKYIMGKGIPVTFGEKKEDKNNEGEGWNYKVESYGDPIEGRLPNK